MADILHPTAWSEIDASNSSGTLPSFPENMPGKDVNNAARAMMGALKRWANQINATVVTTGTSSAYLASYAVSPDGLYNGQRFLILAHATCSSAPTLNINSLGAKTIKKLSSGGIVAVNASDIGINTILDLVYIVALNQFLWINPPAPDTSGSSGGAIAISDVTGLQAALDAKATTVALTAATTTETQSPYSGAGPHTLVAGDAGKLVTVSHSAGVTVNINSSIFAAGTRIDFLQLGDGQVTFGGTATGFSSGSKFKLTGKYSGATVWFRTASEWYLMGDIAA
jgi:hypothetical protein